MTVVLIQLYKLSRLKRKKAAFIAVTPSPSSLPFFFPDFPNPLKHLLWKLYIRLPHRYIPYRLLSCAYLQNKKHKGEARSGSKNFWSEFVHVCHSWLPGKCIENIIYHTVATPVYCRMGHSREKLEVFQKFLVEFVCSSWLPYLPYASKTWYNILLLHSMYGTCSHGVLDWTFSHLWIRSFQYILYINGNLHQWREVQVVL